MDSLYLWIFVCLVVWVKIVILCNGVEWYLCGGGVGGGVTVWLRQKWWSLCGVTMDQLCRGIVEE